jgi:formylmethanofuran dehydrogenase subunit C
MAGQTGGVIVIAGRAGDRAGDRMRRGLIVVAGETGAHAGSRMTGGTLLAGRFGAEPGTLMKRGTLIGALGGAPGPTFVDAGGYAGTFLTLFARHVAAMVPEAAGLVPGRAQRWRGDMATLGKGEILVPRD